MYQAELHTAAVPILTGTYLIKFVDSGGRESANAAIVTNTFVSANFAFVTALIEDPTFEGTKVNCAVAGGELVLDTGEMSMEYVFNNLVDLGVVKNVKIVPDLEAKAVESSNSFCNVVDVCSLASFCGIDADADGCIRDVSDR